jgi:hypothetical protein
MPGLYLDPAEAGIDWLLDPDNPEVVAALRAAAAREPTDECDPMAVVADLPDLLTLLRERHFGLATGVVDGSDLDVWAARWGDRLRLERPATWGAVMGLDLLGLRLMLGDAHTKALSHEDPQLLASADPRVDEPIYVDEGPAFEESVVDGVLCLRVRRLFGDASDEKALTGWREAHERHFAYDRIVVDLRGNRGGNDGHLYEWAEPHNPAEVEVAPADRTWLVDGRPLGGWNSIAQMIALNGAVPPLHEQFRVTPHPGAQLTVGESDGLIPPGEQPWHGRMLVLVDRRTISSGESSAWALRQMFGAKLVGGPTEGCISFGFVVPYLLPRSGMRINLPTKQNLYPGVEFTGIAVDVPLDARTPIADVVARFF